MTHVARDRHEKPEDAMVLAMDHDRMRFACDPYLNPMWKQASQLSTGTDGLLASDAFEDRRSVEQWRIKLEQALRSGIDPESIALKVQSVPKHEQWESVPSTGVERRSIVVRGILGRCLSNHLASILQDTSEALLPPTAVAYRRGSRDAVHEAILRVATAIGIGGGRFWAKLDVQDCFNSLPRKAVAEALSRFGYPQKFVELVMTSVGAPRYRRLQGRLVKQYSDLGCPAGLPESSIVLNILFSSFDREIGRRFPRLTYQRYSDDLLFVGDSETEVEAAVSTLLRWTRAVGLTLKCVSPNQSAQSLVNGIESRSLVFLGAELDQRGTVRIPGEVLEREFAKVRYLLGRAARHSDLVCGPSRFSGEPRRTAGTPTNDLDDVRSSIVGFHRYWFDLDQGEAMIFLARANMEFPLDSMKGTGPFQKLWGAALGAPEDLIGGGYTTDQDMTSEPLEGWFRAEALPLIRDALSATRSGRCGSIADGVEDLWPGGTSDPNDEECCKQAPHCWGRLTERGPASSLSTPGWGDLWSSDAGHGANELIGSAKLACGLSAVPRESAHGCESSGNTAPGSALPPGEPRVPQLRLVLLTHEYDPARDATRVSTDEFSEFAHLLGTWTMTFEHMPPEIAVLDHLLARLRQVGNQRVVVAMRSAWLAKLLLQEGREPRSVGLFQRLRALHHLGQRAIIVGPVRAPDAPLSPAVSGVAD